VDTVYAHAPIGDFRKKRVTCRGIVKVKENPVHKHKVAEVRMNFNGGYGKFFPAENGRVPIVSTNANKGTTTRRGEFMIFNSFGKKVYLAFSFSYMSRGASR
jgi:hypothetical protein